MKKLCHLFLCVGATMLFVVAAPGYAEEVKIGVVNFKTCLEQSKIGKEEQASFEAMKKQMESILEEKGKVLEALETKFQDSDYMDSLSPEAETEFNRKARGLKNEFMQLQNQYMQTLNQANMKIVQKLNDLISKASKEIATEKKLDIVLNDEGCFFSSARLDISGLISTKMDEIASKEAKSEKGLVPGLS